MVERWCNPLNPIDLITGFIIIMAGFITILGMINLGLVLAGIEVLIEDIKIMVQQGL